MSAHGKSRKPVLLAAVPCLLVAAAVGGYAVANNHSPANGRGAETLKLAGAQGSTSGKNTTFFACLAGGKLTHVSMAAAPTCPAKSVLVQWSGQSGQESSPQPQPSSAASTKPPTSSPTSAPPTPAPSKSSTPAPTAPSTPAPTQSGQGTSCVTTSGQGTCGPYTYAGITGSGGQSTFVIQDVWNPINGATQTLTAFSPGDWSVSADMPASNTAVVSYPDTQEIYTTTSDTPKPLSSFGSITSSYTENSPAGGGGDYEAAYDIWAGTGSNNYAQEIMIWVDNHGQTPAGSAVASATIDGVGYKVWSTSGAGKVGDTVSMVLNSNQSAGSVNVLDDLNWLESNGYMPAGSGLNQIDFGWEICSTGGVPETFSLSQYGIKSS
jgi:glycosyl hydrolase family 12